MKPTTSTVLAGAALALSLAAGAAAQPVAPPTGRLPVVCPPTPPVAAPKPWPRRSAAPSACRWSAATSAATWFKHSASSAMPAERRSSNVQCGEAETAKSCADITLAVLDKGQRQRRAEVAASFPGLSIAGNEGRSPMLRDDINANGVIAAVRSSYLLAWQLGRTRFPDTRHAADA